MSKKAPRRAYENQCLMLTKTYQNSLQAAGFIQQTPLVNLLGTFWLAPSLAQQPTSLYSSLSCLAPYFPQPLQAKWEPVSLH